MTDPSKQTPWWVPDSETKGIFRVIGYVLIPLAVWDLATLAVRAVQHYNHGVLVLAIGIAFLTDWLLKFFRQSGMFKPGSSVQEGLEHLSRFFVVCIFCLPLIVSCNENGTLAASWNPIGYWTDELKAAKAENCKFLDQSVADGSESLIVAQKKYSMGISTSREVREEMESLKFVKKLQGDCVRSVLERILYAEKQLLRIEDS